MNNRPEPEHAAAGAAGRTPNCLKKLERMRKALRHEEPDRVPVADFFWGSFVERWRRELGLSADADPLRHYDLDWTAVTPNMDPWIRPFEVLKDTPEEVVVRTGFGAVMHKHFAYPMAEMRDWQTDTFEKLERAEFDDPRDGRRFFSAGDNHLAGVGDGFQRDTPAWMETVNRLRPDFPVYGGVIEPNECLTRLVGQENAMLWMGEEPERMGAVIGRIGAFYLEVAKAEIEAAAGQLDGLVVWGDVAYKRGTFMSPRYWREYFGPWLRRMTELAHANGLPVIYHSCGNVRAIIADFVDMGIDAANPLEVKAGLDALELRREFGHRIGLCGNSDIRVWEGGDHDAIRREVLRKLNAGKGGGYIFQSDHSVTSGVSGRTYDGIVKLVLEFGTYPLRLGEFDEPVDGPARP